MVTRIDVASLTKPSSTLTCGAYPKSRFAAEISYQWLVDSCETTNRVVGGSADKRNRR